LPEALNFLSVFICIIRGDMLSLSAAKPKNIKGCPDYETTPSMAK